MCNYPFGETSSQVSGTPKLEIFEYKSIKPIAGSDNLYEVTLEFKVEDTDPSVQRSIIFQNPQIPSWVSSMNMRFDYNGNAANHFIIKWPMVIQHGDGNQLCTTPFSIELLMIRDIWNPDYYYYYHDCATGVSQGDYPLQCWSECTEQSQPEPTTATSYIDQPITNVATDINPLPTPINCPLEWNGDSVCDVPIGSYASSTGAPPVEIFRFKSIRYIKDGLYEWVFEFKINPTGSEGDLNMAYVQNFISHNNGATPQPQIIQVNDFDYSGGSPFHFYLLWQQPSQTIGDLTCTTPFTILYYFTNGMYTYKHGCDADGTDLPLQCWKEICPPEESATITEESATSSAKTTTKSHCKRKVKR
ncbi:uncharacterized protein SPAPADRAFT_52704 [Spathaspora passalidarum NRRL Y-27907]|uniref:Flo11 domain-containing protein n=1 Tax=Spathaspora passalidarum (strain NRRL Y-27907 / 11-Y1) TaxID=619300 RepID=G3AUS9_SPAPN|nr:uncharacterized protein SPAPADRAFT_52704 [Spathaspora passalidarum NRRL Y-27907]EGW30635.1 hypothetical protein SPAPADRAFT_52704 [Spathaspora passalidarum NRRL Y-27907]